MIVNAIFSLLDKGLLLNKAVVSAAGLVGVVNFVATEVLTQNTILAAIFSAISIPAAAYFAARPKIIAAQAARDAAERSAQIIEFKTLLEQMTSIHEKEVSIKERQLDEKEIENKLLRISKHNALKALQHAHLHIFSLESGEDIARFKPILMEEISGHEDAQTRELVNAAAGRIAASAAQNGGNA